MHLKRDCPKAFDIIPICTIHYVQTKKLTLHGVLGESQRPVMQPEWDQLGKELKTPTLFTPQGPESPGILILTSFDLFYSVDSMSLLLFVLFFQKLKKAMFLFWCVFFVPRTEDDSISSVRVFVKSDLFSLLLWQSLHLLWQKHHSVFSFKAAVLTCPHTLLFPM